MGEYTCPTPPHDLYSVGNVNNCFNTVFKISTYLIVCQFFMRKIAAQLPFLTHCYYISESESVGA